jgi:GAF domain-containing protein
MTTEDEIIQLLLRIRYGDQLSKRLLIWMQVLETLVTRLEMTSGYICRHDFRRHETISVCQYTGSQSSADESEAHPGETFFESEFPNTLVWLRNGGFEPRVVHAAEVEPDDPELQEYLENDVKTVLLAKLVASDGVWGYIELWDTKRQCQFDQQELEIVKKIASAVSQSISQ